MSRWTFSARHLWTGSIYCGLSRTSPSDLYRSGLVHTVSSHIPSCGWTCHYSACVHRCTAAPESIDTGGVPRGMEHRRGLALLDDPKTLWENYGMVSNVDVSHFYFLWRCVIFPSHPAIYRCIPTCRHLRTYRARSFASNNQRHLQGSPRDLGGEISRSYAWSDMCKWDIAWHWQTVHALTIHMIDTTYSCVDL